MSIKVGKHKTLAVKARTENEDILLMICPCHITHNTTLKSIRAFCHSLKPKNEVSIKDFFSKCDQICRKLRIWSHLLKKSLMKNFIFCAVSLKPKCGVKELYVNINYHFDYYLKIKSFLRYILLPRLCVNT